MADKNITRRRITKDNLTQETRSYIKDEDGDEDVRESVADPSTRRRGFNLLDIFKAIIVTLALSAALSWFITGESFLWGWKPWWSQASAVRSWMRGPIYLTEEDLVTYNGVDPKKPIYLALNGSIYDVSAGQKTYGPGGSYHFFAGRDAARAFITGCFQEDLTSDLRGVEAMYIPKDDPEADAKLTKTELKLRKEREKRAARKQVKDTIEGWEKVFRGETGRPYFWAGQIKRDKNWLEQVPERKLCQQAEEGRPKRDKSNKAAS